jgi:hypothetical protein
MITFILPPYLHGTSVQLEDSLHLTFAKLGLQKHNPGQYYVYSQNPSLGDIQNGILKDVIFHNQSPAHCASRVSQSKTWKN